MVFRYLSSYIYIFSSIEMIGVLILLSFAPAVFAAPCNYPWVNFRGSCYLFVTTLTESWSEAATMCNRLGGSSLVEIESAEENNFLKSHIRNTLHIQIDDRQIKSSFWIGGTDFIVEGQWVWISTQKNLTYSDWAHDEPNGKISENCAQLGAHENLQWNDADCHLLYNYICETEALLGGSDIVG